jgi:hypothetical protein
VFIHIKRSILARPSARSLFTISEEKLVQIEEDLGTLFDEGDLPINDDNEVLLL